MDQRDKEATEPRFSDHRDCTTLTGLTFEHLPRDGSLGKTRRYRKGAFLWTSEISEHFIYFLERGQVAVMLNDAAGCDVIVRVIGPGEPFGELCFCSNRERARENCAKAVVDCEVRQIGFDDFMIYLQRNSDALIEFTFTLCKRLADAESRIEVLSYRGAEARLGRLLLQLAATGGVASLSRPDKVKLPIGHDELARMAAMSRPHVSVTMSKLRDRRLVHYDRASQLTVDVVRLAEYVNRKKTKRLLD